MKNDYSFKLVAAIVFAGVVIAFASPNRDVHPSDTNAAEVAPATAHTE